MTPMQSIRGIAEMIAQFRTPPGIDWRPLADDIETALKAERETCLKEAQAEMKLWDEGHSGWNAASAIANRIRNLTKF